MEEDSKGWRDKGEKTTQRKKIEQNKLAAAE